MKADSPHIVKTVGNAELLTEVERITLEGGSVGMRVAGNSMRPFLLGGRDEVVLVRADAPALRKGMVVLFRYRGRYFLHRIRRIQGEVLVMEGDGNYRISEKALRSDVVCYAGQAVRNGKMIRYLSFRWYFLSALSIVVKICRTAYWDMRRHESAST